jgi:hypothetical protein
VLVLLLFVSCFAPVTGLRAQTAAGIAGRVLDPAGLPADHASLTLRNTLTGAQRMQ